MYGKSQESLLPDSLLHDHFAAEAIRRIDYDFEKLKINRDMMIDLAMRAHLFDTEARNFIGRHPGATVLHLGCGLDTRVFRIDPDEDVHWFDVDYPEVIALRRRLYPERESYTLIESSVTEPGWIECIPADRPTLILAEGLTPYLKAEEGFLLFNRLTTHLSSGEAFFDAYNKLGLRLIGSVPSIKVTGAAVYWAIEDPHEFEKTVPRMKLVGEIRAYDPKAYDPRQLARMTLPSRITTWVFTLVPALGKMGRLLRYRF